MWGGRCAGLEGACDVRRRLRPERASFSCCNTCTPAALPHHTATQVQPAQPPPHLVFSRAWAMLHCVTFMRWLISVATRLPSLQGRKGGAGKAHDCSAISQPQGQADAAPKQPQGGLARHRRRSRSWPAKRECPAASSPQIPRPAHPPIVADDEVRLAALPRKQRPVSNDSCDSRCWGAGARSDLIQPQRLLPAGST